MALLIPRVKPLGWVDDELLTAAQTTQMDLNISLLDGDVSYVKNITVPTQAAINWPERATSSALSPTPAVNSEVSLCAFDRGGLTGLILLSISCSKDVLRSVDGGVTWPTSGSNLTTASTTKPELAAGFVDGVPTAMTLTDDGNSYLRTTDAVTWTAGNILFAASRPGVNIAYSASLNRWVALTNSTLTHYVAGTAAGMAANWSAGTAPGAWLTNAGGCKRLVWNGSLFVALPTSSYNKCLTSSDGITWTERTLPFAATWTGLAYSASAGLWMAINRDAGNAAVSADGLTWSAPTGTNYTTGNDLAVNGYVWVMPTTSGNYGGIAYSVDNGATWARGPCVGNHVVATAGWNRILATPDRRFVVAHQTGAANTEFQLSLRAG